MFWPANNLWPADFWPACYWPDHGRQFRIYRAAEADALQLLAVRFADARDIDLSGMLSEGRHSIAISYRNQYGFDSPFATLAVRVDEHGYVATDLREIASIEAAADTGGMVTLRWSVQRRQSWMTDPQLFEVVRADQPGHVLATVAFQGSTASVQIGPFPHARTLRFAVRSVAGAVASDWRATGPVAVDAEGPAPPRLG